ncbi:hypothetical protein [Pseudonocardia sp. H11422]|uniref:hypothetical protein n=1 Tax=Pseudonocardia sp. H11422 TaxID=2835866 RepID=UPI001BDCC3F6|nr:hypothetical protein [Pseudonocardia sp. H11422]
MITDWFQLGAPVRAGVLADLHLTGEISDRNGRAAIERRQAHAEALEQWLLGRASASRPLSWTKWIGDEAKKGAQVARDRLIPYRNRRFPRITRRTRSTRGRLKIFIYRS